MTYIIVASILIASSALFSVQAGNGDFKSGTEPMKTFTVDLDKPPEERWLHLLSVYNSSVPLIVDYFKHEGTKIEQTVLEELLGNLNSYFGEYGVEMKAIADFFGIDLGVVVTLNLSYELRRLGGGHPNTTGNVTSSYSGGMACTSIVAQNKTGNVFHGRNLDWNIPDNLRNLTVQVDFLKGGQHVFSGNVVVGIVGIFTGISKQGGFSLSINERSLGGSIEKNAMEGLLKHSQLPSLLTREVLTYSASYTDALKQLQTVSLIAPVYYITAGSGPNEGMVITRDRETCVDTWLLDEHEPGSNQTISNWYLLETNYDHWKTPLPYDDRRKFGIKYMNSLGQDEAASTQGLQHVLSEWPVRNNLTSYTTLMTPGEFYMQSYIVYN